MFTYLLSTFKIRLPSSENHRFMDLNFTGWGCGTVKDSITASHFIIFLFLFIVGNYIANNGLCTVCIYLYTYIPKRGFRKYSDTFTPFTHSTVS